MHTASRGLALGAGLAVLWLIMGSHALFFTACAVILYSTMLPVAMMRSIDKVGVSVALRRQLVMMGKPDMVSIALTGTEPYSPLRYGLSLSLPPYLIKKHERRTYLALMVFFEANRRGLYQVGDTIVTVEDPLRVFSLSRVFPSSQRVTVFPRLLSFPRLRIALTSPLDGQRVRYAPNVDTSQLSGTHPYDGEPMNRIHWKVSAHAGALQAKDFSPSASKTVVILLNLTLRHTPVFDRDVFEDYMCTVAGSIANYAGDAHLPFGLIVLGREQLTSGYGTGSAHLVKCLSLLARAQSVIEPDSARAVFLDYLQTRRFAIPPRSQLFLVQQEMTENEIGALLRMRAQFSRLSIALFPQGSFRHYGEHKTPYFMQDYVQIERLRSA
ncbi:MAG TPA: DUF58 domain-containing protein, partial [Clostridia bacterium]|nr:DUF58 domain-containing protein [Clostridia bacterium]